MLKLEKRQTYFRHSVLNKERHVEVETKKVTLGTRALRARVESNLTAEEENQTKGEKRHLSPLLLLSAFYSVVL